MNTAGTGVSAKTEKDLIFAPFITILEKEIRRFLKVSVQTVLTPIVSSLLYLLIFGVSLGKHIQLESGISYLAFVIPGLVMMACLNNAFQNSSSSVITSKFSGDLEDLKVSPVSLMQITLALAIGGLFRGVLVGSITYMVGVVFYKYSTGEWLGIAHPLALIYFLFLGGVAFALLGLGAAMMAKSFEQISAVNSFVLLPLVYLGGVFFSVTTLHPFWQTVAKWNPLLYFINGVRYGILGQSDVNLTVAVIVSSLTLLGFYIFAHVMLRRASFVRW